MSSIFKMAWRNLWRNKRRTMITIASVFFAVFFAILMRSLQLGAYGHMYKSIIEAYTGYIQIQHMDYWDDRSIDKGFFVTPELIENVTAIDNVIGVIPHTETFALAANESQTKVSMVVGIVPEKEKLNSRLDEKIVRWRLSNEAIRNITSKISDSSLISLIKDKESRSYANKSSLELDLGLTEDDFAKVFPLINQFAGYSGEYLSKDDDGVLIADRLAKYLGIDVHDSLVLFGQGYHGSTAAGIYPVRGIVRIQNPEIDNLAVYMTAQSSSNFVGVDNYVSSLIVEIDNKDYDKVVSTTNKLNDILEKDGFVARDWKKLNEVMVQQLEADNAGGAIMLFILYLVISFGVFGTVLMMTSERKREFGVLVSIGMQKRRLALIVSIELLYLGFIGILSGMIATIPIVLFGHNNPLKMDGEMAKSFEGYGFEPVMPMQWFGDYYLWQALVVVVIVLLAMIYPVRKILKLKEIQALRA